MQEEQPRRKQRTPLSPTELYYFIELKKLKQQQKLESFKSGFFYKAVNRANIALAAFLAYCLLSIFTLNYWQKAYISRVAWSYGVSANKLVRTVSELRIETFLGETIIAKTDDLTELPQKYQEVFIGKDYLFNKILKIKLSYNQHSFWSINSYARLTVCFFALVIGFFVYTVNKHLTSNGLLVSFGLFFLAALYFILV